MGRTAVIVVDGYSPRTVDAMRDAIRFPWIEVCHSCPQVAFQYGAGYVEVQPCRGARGDFGLAIRL